MGKQTQDKDFNREDERMWIVKCSKCDWEIGFHKYPESMYLHENCPSGKRVPMFIEGEE